jgi:transcriptional regulator with XRE-family HTH domain
LNSEKIDINARVNQILKHKNWTKIKLAEISNVPMVTISTVRRVNNPRLSLVAKIALAASVSVRGMLGDELALHRQLVALCVEFKKPDVAKNVRRIFAEKRAIGITQASISQKMGILPTWWAPTLNSNNPNMKTLQRIADGLGVDVAELV